MDIKVLLSTTKDKQVSEQYLVNENQTSGLNYCIQFTDSYSIFYPEINHTLLGFPIINLSENWLKR